VVVILALLLAYLFLLKRRQFTFRQLKLLTAAVLCVSIIEIAYWYSFQIYLYKLPNNFFGASALKNPSYLKLVLYNLILNNFLLSLLMAAILSFVLIVVLKFRPKAVKKEEIALFFVLAFLVGWERSGILLASAFIIMILVHISIHLKRACIERLSIYPYLLLSGFVLSLLNIIQTAIKI